MARPALDQATTSSPQDLVSQAGVQTDSQQSVDNSVRAQSGAAAVSRIAGQGDPEIDATREAMGQRVISNMDAANSTPGGYLGCLTAGINYSYNFQLGLQMATALLALDPKKPDTLVLQSYFAPADYQDDKGQVDLGKVRTLIDLGKDALARSPIKKWDRDYELGYAPSQYFVRTGFMSWKLKPGVKPSDAVKAWLKGPTIAECLSTMVVILVDTYRAAIGDAQFDRTWGDGTDSDKIPLVLSQDVDRAPIATVLTNDRTSPTDGSPGKRNVYPGDWCYFCNHPMYPVKHPGGAWRGENAIYLGEVNGQQTFGGLGATGKTEDQMLDEMVEAYNAPRDENDQNALDDMKKDGGTIPDVYDPLKGKWPDQVTKKDILDAPEFAGMKGGFTVGSIYRLDAEAVQKDRPAKKPSDRGGR